MSAGKWRPFCLGLNVLSCMIIQGIVMVNNFTNFTFGYILPFQSNQLAVGSKQHPVEFLHCLFWVGCGCSVFHIIKAGCWVSRLSLLARLMGPKWDPPGADRTQVGPCWPHEPCYLSIPDTHKGLTTKPWRQQAGRSPKSGYRVLMDTSS